jgi:hypothetical protein
VSLSEEDPSAVVDAYFANVRAHDPGAVRALFTDDAELRTGGRLFVGAAAIGDFYTAALDGSDLAPQAGEYLVVGQQIAVEITARSNGNLRAVADFFTLEAGKIRRLSTYSAPYPEAQS